MDKIGGPLFVFCSEFVYNRPSMNRGVATFTLDHGRCPRWLFERMVRLGREMTELLIIQYGPDEFVRRLADPVWFQTLGTVLAFDWNASGLTTILTAALKESIRDREPELGVFICGGKGRAAIKTPAEIRGWGERLALPSSEAESLVYNSRMSAKVDSSLVQDGYQIYHHCFVFSKNGSWAVIQQGMNTDDQTARRYHWFSKNIKELICEPHAGIASQLFKPVVLNLAAKKSSQARALSMELVGSGYRAVMNDVQILRRHSSSLSRTISLKTRKETLTLLSLGSKEFKYHPVLLEDFSKSKYLEKIFWRLCDQKPKDYEQLLGAEGVGPKTIRALALIAEVIYGAKPSYEDPARYSFAHGGKDGTPFPVDRATYDQTIAILKKTVWKTNLELSEKQRAARRIEDLAFKNSSGIL